jgi:acetolactate decarboxylase
VPEIWANIPASLKSALNEEVSRSGRGISSLVAAALAQYLERPIHTVFQVSTSGALVAGVYDREVSVRIILEHGNLGLGTFANLDGEMVIVDGHCIRCRGLAAYRSQAVGFRN